MKKADNGNRTRLSGLGSRRSTDEPYLHGNHYSTLTLKFKLKFNKKIRQKTGWQAEISDLSTGVCRIFTL